VTLPGESTCPELRAWLLAERGVRLAGTRSATANR
jgi:hypothetical protein